MPDGKAMMGQEKSNRRFRLKARVRSANLRAIEAVLKGFVTNGAVRRVGDEFTVEAEMEGLSAKDLNRTLLSALRKLEKRTTLRAEWTCDNITERFFDYVLKKTTKN